MIKKLRIVFITVTMFLVAVMLVSIFGVIIFSTYLDLSNNSLQVLQELQQLPLYLPYQ